VPLFESPLPVQWLPGETAYSLVARFHRVSGHKTSAQTATTLFGRANAGGSPTIPTGIDRLCATAGGQLGDSASVISAHCAVAYYLPFLTLAQAENVTSAMRGTQTAADRVRAILSSSYLSRDLRSCPDCIHADQKKFGVAYWHVDHQLPCVWVCPRHNCWLTSTKILESQTWLSRWQLPDVLRPANLELAAIPQYSRLAHIAHRLVSEPTGRFEASRVQATYLAALNKSREQLDILLATLRQGRPSSSADLGAPTIRLLIKPIARSLKSINSELHPILILGLFETVESFISHYEANTATSPTDGLRRLKPAALRDRCTGLMRDGASATEAARQVGVDVTTAQNWLAAIGTRSSVRPKKLRDDVRKTATELLMRGASKDLVASVAQISVTAVTRLMGVEPGLRQAWHAARSANALSAAKEHFEKIALEFPDASAQVCRLLEPASYALLYRNERSWLLHFLSSRPVPPGRNVDSTRQDKLLCRRIMEGLRGVAHSSTRRIDSVDLAVQIGELHSAVPNLANFPLTAKGLVKARSEIARHQLDLFNFGGSSY
jgi:hypothetical protein